MRILLTGFEPYGGERINASEILVRAYQRRILGTRPHANIYCSILPSQPQRLKRRLVTLLRRYRPGFVVLAGQAPGRGSICLEQRARNYFEGRPICGTGAETLYSTLPAQANLVNALCKAGIPAALSGDAGDYLCNMALYLALRHTQTGSLRTRVAFVHVPVLPSQTINFWQGVPSQSMSSLLRAIQIIVEFCSLTVAARSGNSGLGSKIGPVSMKIAGRRE